MSDANHRLHRAAGLVLIILMGGSAVLLAYGLSAGRSVYALPLAVFIGLLLAALRLPHPRRAKLALFLVSVVLCCYAAEVVLAALLPFRPAFAAWQGGREYDFRTYHRVVRDLRDQGVEAFPALMPRPFLTNWQQDWPVYPLGGISETTTVYCNETGRYLIYESDQHGFYNPPGMWGEKVQLAVVGDSFAHGACVDPSEAFVNRMRKRYPATLNLAMGANGPLTVFAGVKEYLTVLEPRLVLWFFYEGNDLFDLLMESSNPVLMRYLREEDFRQDLLNRQPEIDRLLKDFAEQELDLDREFNPLVDFVVHRSSFERLLGVLRMAHLRGAIIQAFDDPWNQTLPLQLSEFELLREVMSRAKSLTESWDGKFYIVFLPGWGLAVSDESKQETIYQRVVDAAAELKIPLIDLVPVFRAQPEPGRLFVYPGSHYNAKGNRVVAETVLDRLQGFKPLHNSSSPSANGESAAPLTSIRNRERAVQ